MLAVWIDLCLVPTTWLEQHSTIIELLSSRSAKHIAGVDQELM